MVMMDAYIKMFRLKGSWWGLDLRLDLFVEDFGGQAQIAKGDQN
jgi:hypothetical protein